jgi:TM2 domain-containing membrane protein YozV
MPEERICPLCGRANPLTMPRCMNCGQRVTRSGGTDSNATDNRATQGSGTVLVEKSEEATAGTGHEPWWRSSATEPGTMPLPPQIREQTQREELARAESQRREARLRAEEAERLRQDAVDAELKRRQELDQQRRAEDVTILWKKTPVCTRCGSELERNGQGFSFCHECGADAPASAVLPQSPVAPRPTHTVHPSHAAQTHTSASHPSASLGGVAHRPVTHSASQSYSTLNSVQQQKSQVSRVNPTTAAVFSFFIPGVGQMMNGQGVKGALLLMASFIITTFFGMTSFGVVSLIVRIIAAIDSYRIAERRRNGEVVRESEWDLG